MPRQPTPLSAVEFDVLLSRWRIFETDDCLKRLVGYNLLDQEFVTSALVSFNHKVMRAKTSDGLTYQFVGKPGWFWDVVDVWDAWFKQRRRRQGCDGAAAREVNERPRCLARAGRQTSARC
ncbi:hypothetical protein [Burkholderia pseudomallei]|uniref:hypothetical protein n=1 Tax=Burkholderia pseudomallei TaxID=28450 RepID=UPI00100BF6CE|nr:hypothetical protein [Burkholderia pseudomallei]